MALSKDCQAWLDKTSQEFMVPVAEYFTTAELADESEDVSGPFEEGWHSRLSAPGYLDCTEWIGPYTTEDEAFEALYETYGDD